MPDTPSQLDPKIKEAYDRVMNTAIAAAPASPTTPPSQTTATTPPTSAPPAQNVVRTTVTQTIPTVTPRQPEKIHIGPAPQGFSAVKKSSETSPVLYIAYIIGGIIFLAVYTIFWLKFFQVPTPFLPF